MSDDDKSSSGDETLRKFVGGGPVWERAEYHAKQSMQLKQQQRQRELALMPLSITDAGERGEGDGGEESIRGGGGV